MEPSERSDNGTMLLQLRDLLNYSPLARRQIAVLAIPTTYTGLNTGPQPGAVVGIVLGRQLQGVGAGSVQIFLGGAKLIRRGGA